MEKQCSVGAIKTFYDLWIAIKIVLRFFFSASVTFLIRLKLKKGFVRVDIILRGGY